MKILSSDCEEIRIELSKEGAMRTGWRMLHADFLLTVYVNSVYYYNVAAQVGEFEKIVIDKKNPIICRYA